MKNDWWSWCLVAVEYGLCCRSAGELVKSSWMTAIVARKLLLEGYKCSNMQALVNIIMDNLALSRKLLELAVTLGQSDGKLGGKEISTDWWEQNWNKGFFQHERDMIFVPNASDRLRACEQIASRIYLGYHPCFAPTDYRWTSGRNWYGKVFILKSFKSSLLLCEKWK